MRNYHICTLERVKDVCQLLIQEKYTEKIEVLSNSSIGQHIRHIIEFYECLSQGCKEGYINYDDRKRNLLIETLPDYATALISDLQKELENVDLDANIFVIHEIGNEKHEIKTTLARELYYMAEHTVHHFALIKIGINSAFPELKLPENFGIAESTIKYHQSQEICAS
jgi:uncharacterized damage-inducible protein DinB